MATSNSHKLGQFIGDTLEIAILPRLTKFAADYGVFLDKKGARVCRASKKLSWRDGNGNTHDLDFVLEKGGTNNTLGEPVAFIETAWRRYTKHSRAKAQEIQGAIEPLCAHYRRLSPFKGALLAGVFTEGALTQLRSLGFKVVYVPYSQVVHAFASENVDVAFDESTSERLLGRKVKSCHALTEAQRGRIAERMLQANANELASFFDGLRNAVKRKVTKIRILALFGSVVEVSDLTQAIKVVNDLAEEATEPPLHRYEIRIEFSNGDYIEGEFTSKAEAVRFLEATGV